MNSKEQEYKELFLAEALDNFEEVSRLLTDLEKNTQDTNVVNAIFRITHTLKGNAAGMGFTKIAEFSHVMEDLFGEVREGRLVLNSDILSMLFRAVDTLGALIQSLKTDEVVRQRGIQTKMEVLIKNSKGAAAPGASEPSPAPKAEPAAVKTEEKVEETKPAAKPKAKKKKAAAKKVEATAEPPKKEETKEEDQENASVETSEAIKANKPAEAKAANEVAEEPEVEEQKENKIAFSDLVQVPVRKLDNLLNLVGELIIERDRIIAANSEKANEYSRLNRISSDLQYSVMDVRLVQVGFLFNKFHRVARDAAAIEGKKVNLKLSGTDTEIDRNILQIISDSLIHIVRNSIGHGVEKPDVRKKAGKSDEGTIELAAKSESDAVIIDIIDDGCGIDVEVVKQKAISKGLLQPEFAEQLDESEIIMYIFEPGFSTAESVTAISGRGVGMDVVKKALDSIGGSVTVKTERGKGTTISLRLPSSMAVKGTLLFELNSETFAIPLTYTEAVVSLRKSDIHKVGKGLVATHQKKSISIVFLNDVFDLNDNSAIADNYLHKSFDAIEEDRPLDIVICSYNNRTVGFVVDKLLQRKEIVEKPLMKPVDKVKFVNGVTIMGNGNVCLVINVAGIANFIYSQHFRN